MNKHSQRNTVSRGVAALLTMSIVGIATMSSTTQAESFRVCKNEVGKTYITKATMDCPAEYSANVNMHDTGPDKRGDVAQPSLVNKAATVSTKTAAEPAATPEHTDKPTTVTKPEPMAQEPAPKAASAKTAAAKPVVVTKPEVAVPAVPVVPVAPAVPVVEKPVDPAAVADSVEGRALFDKEDYAGALPLLQKAAAGGDHDAQFTLGKVYAYGRGVERDYIEAYKWHTLAGTIAVRERQVLEKIMPDADVAEGKKRAQAAQQ